MRDALAVLLVAAACGAVVPSHASERQQFTGTAHDLKTGKVIFVESYDVEVDNGRWRSGTTRYATPDGKTIGERKFDFAKDNYVPTYSFDQTNVDYREGITRVDAQQIDLFVVRGGKRETATIPRVGTMVGDCGSQPYLIDHLGVLDKGETIHFTLAVAGKTDSFRLRARKVEDRTVDGRRAMRIRIELDSLLRLILPPLELTIDPESKRLIEYSGIANLKDPATQKSFSARIAFSYR